MMRISRSGVAIWSCKSAVTSSDREMIIAGSSVTQVSKEPAIDDLQLAIASSATLSQTGNLVLEKEAFHIPHFEMLLILNLLPTGILIDLNRENQYLLWIQSLHNQKQCLLKTVLTVTENTKKLYTTYTRRSFLLFACVIRKTKWTLKMFCRKAL